MEALSVAKPFPLFKLPLELRQEIYTLAIGNLKPALAPTSIEDYEKGLTLHGQYEVERVANRKSQKTFHYLLNTCRQIRLEMRLFLSPRRSELLRSSNLRTH